MAGFRRNNKIVEAKSFDTFAYAMTNIDEPHRMIHDGFMYSIEHSQGNVANGASLDILLSVPAVTFPHLRQIGVRVEDTPCTLFFYEDVETSNDGSSLSVYNRNRNSSNTPSTVATVGPTVSDTGTELEQRLLPTSGGFFSVAGVAAEGFSEEWVLKPDTKYLWRVTNNAGSAIDITVDILWYEIDY